MDTSLYPLPRHPIAPSPVKPGAPPPTPKKPEKAPRGKGIWITIVFVAFIIGLIFGYGIGHGATSREAATKIITQIVTTTVSTIIKEEVKVTETLTITTLASSTYTPLTREELTIRIGEKISVGSWEIFITSFREAAYIKSDEFYYKAKEGMKTFLLNMKLTNRANEIESTSNIWQFVLVTNKGKSHEDTSLLSLESIYEATPEIEEQAIAFHYRFLGQNVAPKTSVEEQLLFQVPVDEKPVAVYFKVGIFSPKTVTVLLEQS